MHDSRKAFLKHSLLLAAGVSVAGCDAIAGLTSGDCTTIEVPGISVHVVDSLTGMNVAPGSTVRVRDGTYIDSITIAAAVPDTSFIPIFLANERPGVYQVAVSHSGYRDWAASDVRVRQDHCHVRTANLVARLVREP